MEKEGLCEDSEVISQCFRCFFFAVATFFSITFFFRFLLIGHHQVLSPSLCFQLISFFFFFFFKLQLNAFGLFTQRK